MPASITIGPDMEAAFWKQYEASRSKRWKQLRLFPLPGSDPFRLLLLSRLRFMKWELEDREDKEEHCTSEEGAGCALVRDNMNGVCW